MIYSERSSVHALRLLTLNLAILSFILFLLTLSSVIDFFISSTNLLVTGVVFAATSLFLWMKKERSSDITRLFFIVSPYIFLGLLGILALNEFFTWDFIANQSARVSIVTLFFGVAALWSHRTSIGSDIDGARTREKHAEHQRSSEFAHRFPMINNIWGVRIIVRWMYTEGWIYSGALIILALWGFVLRIWNIRDIYLRSDEILILLSAKGILSTGLPYTPSGWLYFREPLTLYLISLGPFFFGFNEFGIRIVPILCGIASIFATYLLAKLFVSKPYALIASALMSLSVVMIAFSRFSRFYIVFQLFSIITIYCMFLFIERKETKFFYYAIVLSIASFFAHRIGILFIFVAALLIIDTFVSNSSPRKIWYVVYCTVLLIPAFYFLFEDTLKELFTQYLFGGGITYRFNWLFNHLGNSYHLLISNFGFIFVLLSLLGLGLFLLGTKSYKSKLLFIFLLVAAPLIIDMVIFSQGFLTRIRYIFFIIPFFIIFYVLGVKAIFTSFNKVLAFVISAILLASLFPYLSLDVTKFYSFEDAHEFDNAATKNYALIKEVCDPIVIATPIEVISYYWAKPNFWITSSNNEISLKVGKYHKYVKVPIISEVKELESLASKNPHILYIIEEDKIKFIKKDAYDYIKKNYVFIPEASDDNIEVYGSPSCAI
jgi:hypothetical protein